MTKIWVKFKTNNAVKVFTEECQDVDDFLEACKEKLSPLLDSYAPAQLCLSTTDGGLALRPGLLLTAIPSQPGYVENDDEHPLFISVADGSVIQPLVPTFWRTTGSITGARKMGYRRGMYRTAQTYLGFYEKSNGIKLGPFSYQDDGTLTINVLFEQRSDALHFRAAVYENVDTVSPQGELAVSLSVDLASDAVLDEMVLVRHYVRDDHSPPDTPRPLSGVTELFNTSPLFRYQRLEDERYFGGLYKADRANLIDKPLCEKGKRFAKFQDNENNFLALSKEVHCWFDALSNVSEKIPFFKLFIKHVSSNQDPANDFRYRVLLTVEAYNAETARLFFPRLKDGSLVVNDTQAETFVYVLNPEEFRVCLSWKNNNIDSLWHFTPAVE
jgi:hypothetical protein